VAVITVGVLVVGNGWKIKQMERKWLIDQRITLVDIGQNISVSSVDLTNMTGVKVMMPANLNIQAIEGKGNWEVSAMIKLAEKNGREWLADSVANTLNVTYDAVYQDLNWPEKGYWWWKNRSANIITIDLAKEGFTDEREAPDGDKFRVISEIWGQKAKEYFASRIFLEENYILRLQNASTVPGLGFKTAQILENAGVNVFEVVKSETGVNKSRLIVPEELKKNPSIIWMAQVFSCETVIKPGDKADLIIGEEYRKWIWGGD